GRPPRLRLLGRCRGRRPDARRRRFVGAVGVSRFPRPFPRLVDLKGARLMSFTLSLWLVWADPLDEASARAALPLAAQTAGAPGVVRGGAGGWRRVGAGAAARAEGGRAPAPGRRCGLVMFSTPPAARLPCCPAGARRYDGVAFPAAAPPAVPRDGWMSGGRPD